MYRPRAIVSLAPNPYPFAYQAYLQDWQQWAEWGILDELVVQVYRDNLTSFSQELDSPIITNIRSKIPAAIGILTGLRIKSIPIELIREKVKLTRDKGFHGFAYFFYESLGDRDEDFQELHPHATQRPQRQPS
ncbi:MAG: family 10 glycosylhydrolase [Pseudanabaenaceae cyanobacterium]